MPARSSRNSLNRVDLNRLRTALDQLPSAIAHLRDPILDFDRQDQDLLGCGEADTDVIVQSLRASAEPGVDFADHAACAADQLRGWLESQSEPNSAWAAPAWFAEGFLRGCDLFEADFTTASPPRLVPKGLELVTIEIPAGMRSKLYVGGIELTRRGVQIIVSELDDDTFNIQREAHTRPVPATWPAPPHLVSEIIDPFQIGEATGLKAMTRHIDSGLLGMVFYLLKLSTANVEVALFAKNQRGGDLEQYEPMVASLRCK